MPMSPEARENLEIATWRRVALDMGHHRTAKALADELLLRNLGLAWSAALARCRRRGRDERGAIGIDDLAQAATLGLMRAIEKYDPGRGLALSTLATFWTRQGVEREVEDRGTTIRVPNYLHSRAGAAATPEYRVAARLARSVRSLERDDGPDGRPLRESVPDRSGPSGLDLDDRAILARVRAAIGGLAPRHAAVLRMRFGLDGGRGKTHREVAAVVGVTPEGVRQIESRALAALRLSLGVEPPPDPRKEDRP
jgi:RNA polymerase sigma factor (sigma-70 family)